MSPTQPEIIGLIPAAGRGTRIGPLPCSKEVYPVGFASTDGGRRVPKAVCQYLLEKMRVAGIVKAYVVLREGKWDIPASLGDGATAGMHLAYLMVGISFGVPFTLDQAYPFVRDSRRPFALQCDHRSFVTCFPAALLGVLPRQDT